MKVVQIHPLRSLYRPHSMDHWGVDSISHNEYNGAKLSGPTYKIDNEVEGVKTRALLHSGSQVYW